MSVVKKILAALVDLSNPATDAALIALIVQFLPGVHVDTEALTGILLGVGLLAAAIRSYFKL